MSVYGKVKAHKVWFDHFRKRLTYKNVKITTEATSAIEETADKSPDTIKKITEEKGYLLEQVFKIQTEVPYPEGKIPQRTFISNEQKQTSGFKEERDRITLLFCAN